MAIKVIANASVNGLFAIPHVVAKRFITPSRHKSDFVEG
jgi:hypothetical protein